MPQSSLLGWLNKPTSLQKPEPAKLATARNQLDEGGSKLPTPPTSSQDSLPAKGIEDHNEAFRAIRATKSRELPPNVELRACKKEDISHLKRLNSLLLPIPYPERFYRETIEDPLTNNITLLAVWHDGPAATSKDKGRVVGAIRCRLLAHPPSPEVKKDGPMLYLSTLVLFSPYRSHGIVTRMLDMLTKRAVGDYGITSIGAHVWEANADGLEWYRKRGFREVGREENYYRRLKPSGAVVVQRDVRVMDLVGG